MAITTCLNSIPVAKACQLDQKTSLNQNVSNSLTQYKQQCVIVTVGVVGPNIAVSDYCVIGAECSVLSNERLPPGTVISGKDCRRWNKQVNIKVRERGEERRGGL